MSDLKDYLSDLTRYGTWRVHALAGGVLASLTLAVYLGVVAPARRASERLDEERSAMASNAQEKGNLQASIDQHRARIAALERQLRSIVELKPATYLNRRRSELTDLFERVGLSLSDMKAGEHKDNGQFGAVSLSMSGAGSYGAVVSFLRTLHHEFRDVEVTGLEVTAPADREKGAAHFSLQMTWFTLPEKSGPSAPGGAVSADPAGGGGLQSGGKG